MDLSLTANITSNDNNALNINQKYIKMPKKMYKIASLEDKNMLIRIAKADRNEKVNGLIVNKAPAAHRTAEIVMIGEGVVSDKHQPKIMITVFVQSLEYAYDAEVVGLDTKNYDYFIIHEQQIVAVLEEVTDGGTEV